MEKIPNHHTVGLSTGRFLIKIISISLTFMLLVACGEPVQERNSQGAEQDITVQQPLLDELDRQLLLWQNAAIEEYDFSIHKECECLQAVQAVVNRSVRIGDSPFRSDQNSIQGIQYQINTIESYFADLRRAILLNQIRQIIYNVQYGFPQMVQMVLPNQIPVVIYIQDFRVIQQVQVNPSLDSSANLPVLLSGKINIIASTGNPSDLNYWLLSSAGQFELQVPSELTPSIVTIMSGANVRVTGTWITGVLPGQRQILLSSIQVITEVVNQQIIQGTLTYMIGDPVDTSQPAIYQFSLFDGTHSISLIVPDYLQGKAQNLSQQYVQVKGNMLSTGALSQLFEIIEIELAQQGQEQFIGTLEMLDNPCLVCLGNFNLIQDNGSTFKLNISSQLQSAASSLANQRVIISGFRTGLTSGNFPMLDVRQIDRVTNFVSDTIVSGLILNDLYSGINEPNKRYFFSADTGEQFYISVPRIYQAPGFVLNAGMRVTIAGQWVLNRERMKNELHLNQPPQILSNKNGIIQSFEGAVVSLDCNYDGFRSFYFVSDSGVKIRLRMNPTVNTFISPKSRYKITGSIVGNEFIATSATPIAIAPVVLPQIKGTILNSVDEEILTCTRIKSYTILNENGFQQTLNVSSFFGESFLQTLTPGKNIIVSKYNLSNQSIVIDAMEFFSPTEDQIIELEGAIIARECFGNAFSNYFFVTSDFQRHILRVDYTIEMQTGFELREGVVLVIKGFDRGNIIEVTEITLSPIMSLPTINVINGTILTQGANERLNCNTFYTFELQNDSGSIQQVYVSSELYYQQQMLFQPGTRLQLSLPLNLSGINMDLYPINVMPNY